MNQEKAREAFIDGEKIRLKSWPDHLYQVLHQAQCYTEQCRISTSIAVFDPNNRNEEFEYFYNRITQKSIIGDDMHYTATSGNGSLAPKWIRYAPGNGTTVGRWLFRQEPGSCFLIKYRGQPVDKAVTFNAPPEKKTVVGKLKAPPEAHPTKKRIERIHTLEFDWHDDIWGVNVPGVGHADPATCRFIRGFIGFIYKDRLRSFRPFDNELPVSIQIDLSYLEGED